MKRTKIFFQLKFALIIILLIASCTKQTVTPTPEPEPDPKPKPKPAPDPDPITTGTTNFDNDQYTKIDGGGVSYYKKWSNGIPSDSTFFPIAVWLQNPSINGANYKKMDINTFIGLYKGPTEEQLAGIKYNALTTFCFQKEVGLNSSNNAVIKAWTQVDEPDNARFGNSYPMPPAEVIDRYKAMQSKDNTRPIYLNLGQGVASDYWYGRGDNTNHPEDYTEYVKGGDILSFDIYPMNVYPSSSSDPNFKKLYTEEVAQKPWMVAQGVIRLRKYANYEKPIYVWIETTSIEGDARYALTPKIVAAEVWMAIINGAQGIGYFAHQLKPSVVEAGLLKNEAMKNKVSSINQTITKHAKILNSASISNGVKIKEATTKLEVHTMVKRYGGHTYLYTVGVRPGNATITFELSGHSGQHAISVLGENRKIVSKDGVFKDTFENYDVHIYKIGV